MTRGYRSGKLSVDGQRRFCGSGREGPLLIDQPYLLVLNIPLHWFNGGYWAEPLWKKDLEAHLSGINNLTIACPVKAAPPPLGWAQITSNISVYRLPTMNRTAPLRIPFIAWKLWHVIGRAEIVHTGVAGWPFPLGWLAIPIAKLRRRPVVLVIESAFWRITPGTSNSWRARCRAAIWERINVCVTAVSEVSFFTTVAYRNELRPNRSHNAYVTPAVWIDDNQLIDRGQLAHLTALRSNRMLYAGRLTVAKGVLVLLDAIQQSGIPVDFVGEGELASDIRNAEARFPHLIKLISPVSYGTEFTALLDRYATLIVPTLTDEQPRIIFDAFARGLAVIASETTGNQQLIEHERTGLLFTSGDAAILARMLVDAQADPNRIALLGSAARDTIKGHTHAAMHANRVQLIAETLGFDDKSP